MAIEKSMSKQRAEACLEVFQRILPQCETVEEAFERAAKEPAPRFFVSFPRAYRCVRELEVHGKRVQEPTKAAMFDELHRRWKTKGVKHYADLEDIIDEPAPSFYIAPWTFKALVYKALRNKKKQNGGDKKKN